MRGALIGAWQGFGASKAKRPTAEGPVPSFSFRLIRKGIISPYCPILSNQVLSKYQSRLTTQSVTTQSDHSIRPLTSAPTDGNWGETGDGLGGRNGGTGGRERVKKLTNVHIQLLLLIH